MRVALVLGDAQGKALAPRIAQIRDGVDIDSFDNIEIFLDRTIKRGITYDRVLILANKLNNTNEKDLYNYWNTYSRNTSIVVLGKKGESELVAESFMSTFRTPMVGVAMTVTQSLQLIGECVLDNVANINKKYGLSDGMDVDIEDDSLVIQKPAESQQKSTSEQKKEKRTLMGALFGSKKQKKDEVQTSAKNQQQVQQPVQNNQTKDNFEFQQSNENSMNSYEESQVNADNKGDDEDFHFPDYEPQVPVTNTSTVSQEDETGDDDWGFAVESDENTKVNSHESSPNDVVLGDMNSSDDYVESEQEDDDFASGVVADTTLPDIEFGEVSDQDSVEESWQQEPVHNIPVRKSESERKPETTRQQEPVKHVEQVRKSDPVQRHAQVRVPETKSVESVDNFSFSGVAESPMSTISHSSHGSHALKQSQDIDSVEDDELLSVGDAEASYRNAAEPKEKVKVITKTVVKEVGGKSSILEGIKAGRQKRLVIVTGDRGSGITSTALSLANYLARITDVLYFDCDIKTHGLLNYIDYDEFAAYSNMQLNGIKMCRSARAFDNCVVPIGARLHLLTTDFPCECTNDDIVTAQEIVAEKQSDYGVVIVDCPLERLDLLRDLTLTAEAIFCVEASKRGFMNALCMLEDCQLPTRHKKSLVSRGQILATKCVKDTDLKRLVAHINSFFQADEVEWMSMPISPFNGRLDDKAVSSLLGG